MKKHLSIAGMHCRSCEILVERNLGQIPGVRSVRVNHKTGAATVIIDDNSRPDERAFEKAVRDAGYSIGSSAKKGWIATDSDSWTEAVFATAIVFTLYLFARALGLSSLTVGGNSNAALPVVFVVGLTAGVSTCAALIGGLVLAASARHAELHPEATAAQKFRPHLFFNLGRIASFAVLGGLIGAAGAALQPSALVLGVFTAIVGLVMIAMGLKLTELFPRVDSLIVLPGGIARALGLSKTDTEYSHWRAALTGAVTFVLPCGFTQAMQLAAVASGSFASGAAIMATFALGTAPGLLGIGGLSSVVRGSGARLFFKMAGIVVIVLGVLNISNGWNLTGFVLPSSQNTAVSGTQAQIRDGKQYLMMEQWAGGYNPTNMTVKRGIPVVWQINSTNSYTCASSLVVPALGIRRSLSPGMNTIEFTAQNTGVIKFSCSMGMYTGTITVTD
jgi:sulfite exporter TauE/SafE/copper chaperone CopZ